MVEVKLKITWREYLYSIGREFEGVIMKFLSGIKRYSKRIFKWSIAQIIFLVQFEYNQENIKQHLLNKAARFFGFDLNEGKLKKKKKSKPTRAKYRLNSRGDGAQKSSKSLKRKMQDKKKKKKNAKNIYNPPLELTG